MADLDTAAKRRSAAGLAKVFFGICLVPTGSAAGTSGGRAALCWNYSGIAATVSFTPDNFSWTVYIDRARSNTVYIDRARSNTVYIDRARSFTVEW